MTTTIVNFTKNKKKQRHNLIPFVEHGSGNREK